MKSITQKQMVDIITLLDQRRNLQVKKYLMELPDIRQDAINKIKELRDPKRDIYNLNIDEKSAIPILKEMFGIEEGELKWE